MRKPTIIDVAKDAGVSVATVDRVLNRRAGVRPRTMERVHTAVMRLNYKPVTGKTKRLLFIVREGRNTFMTRLGEAISDLAQELKDENVYIEKRLVDAFDGSSAAGALDAVSSKDWDGVAVMVPDLPLVRQAIDSCVERGVHVVTVVTDLPSSARARFVGIDNTAAGRVAGRLLGRFTLGRPGNLAVVVASLSLRDHVERHLGCIQVVGSEFRHLELLRPFEGRDNPDDTFKVVSELLESPAGQDLRAIYSSGAANEGLIEALKLHGRQKDVVTISHELTPRSRLALLDGTFDAILGQDAKREAEVAVHLLRRLCDNDDPEQRGFIRTEIFLPDNLP